MKYQLEVVSLLIFFWKNKTARYAKRYTQTYSDSNSSHSILFSLANLTLACLFLKISFAIQIISHHQTYFHFDLLSQVTSLSYISCRLASVTSIRLLRSLFKLTTPVTWSSNIKSFRIFSFEPKAFFHHLLLYLSSCLTGTLTGTGSGISPGIRRFIKSLIFFPDFVLIHL